jgi:hypothetical protein
LPSGYYVRSRYNLFGVVTTYLAETLGLCVLLETEGREMNTRAEDLCLGQDTDTTNTVNLHLHVRVAIGVAQVGQMRTPSSIFCITLNNDSVFVECVG